MSSSVAEQPGHQRPGHRPRGARRRGRCLSVPLCRAGTSAISTPNSTGWAARPSCTCRSTQTRRAERGGFPSSVRESRPGHLGPGVVRWRRRRADGDRARGGGGCGRGGVESASDVDAVRAGPCDHVLRTRGAVGVRGGRPARILARVFRGPGRATGGRRPGGRDRVVLCLCSGHGRARDPRGLGACPAGHDAAGPPGRRDRGAAPAAGRAGKADRAGRGAAGPGHSRPGLRGAGAGGGQHCAAATGQRAGRGRRGDRPAVAGGHHPARASGRRALRGPDGGRH